MLIDPEGIHRILQSSRTFALDQGFSPTQAHQIELGLEEALTNVWKHGYGSTSGPLNFKIHFNKDVLRIEIEDAAAHFDPTEHIRPIETPNSLRDARIGGLGLPLMQSCFDEIRYRKLKQGNSLTLCKQLRP